MNLSLISSSTIVILVIRTVVGWLVGWSVRIDGWLVVGWLVKIVGWLVVGWLVVHASGVGWLVGWLVEAKSWWKRRVGGSGVGWLVGGSKELVEAKSWWKQRVGWKRTVIADGAGMLVEQQVHYAKS